MEIAQGSAGGHKNVSTDGEYVFNVDSGTATRALALATDQLSFQSYMSGVSTASRDE